MFSAGVRPRDEIARRSGIDVGERGGIVVDDTLQTSAEHVWAIGEVALHGGRVYGLVAPGYEMAAALAERLSDDGGAPEYRGSDMSTKLKLLGVDVASFGQSNATGDDIDEIVYNDPVNKIFRRLALDATTGALLGGAFVGDTSGYELLTAITLGVATQPDDLPAYVLPSSVRPPDQGDLPDAALLCSCNAVVRRHDPSCGGRWLPDARRRQGQHVRRHELRWMRPGGEQPDPHRTRPARCRGVERALRTLRPVTTGAVRPRSLPPLHARGRRSSTDHGRGRGCEICRPDRGVDPGLARQRIRARRRPGGGAGHQRPCTWPTCSATAPTRWCRGFPAARSRPTS